MTKTITQVEPGAWIPAAYVDHVMAKMDPALPVRITLTCYASAEGVQRVLYFRQEPPDGYQPFFVASGWWVELR